MFPSIPKGETVDYLGCFSLMSTLAKILVVNFGSTKVWVMDPSLVDVYGMIFDIFGGKTILNGYYMSCHFRWYVECHITPHGLRVMTLRS